MVRKCKYLDHITTQNNTQNSTAKKAVQQCQEDKCSHRDANFNTFPYQTQKNTLTSAQLF